MFGKLTTAWNERQKTRSEKKQAILATAHTAAVAQARQQVLNEWTSERDQAQSLVAFAESVGSGPTSSGFIAHAGEALVGAINNCSLVELRNVGGHYTGTSQGISIPIGSLSGRSVRYRVGAQKGHFVAGTPTPTAIDQGTFFISDQRLVFTGATMSKECRFDKLLSLNHSADGTLTIAVSNRQKNTVIHYGPAIISVVDFYLDLALARFHGRNDEFVANLQSAVSEIEARRPA